MKDLLTKDETIKIANDDLAEKLKAEVTKFEKLLHEKQDLLEYNKRKTEKKNADLEVIKDQDQKLSELKALIEEEQKRFDEQAKELDTAKKLQLGEEAKSRDLNQKQAALSAKLKYIEEHYDHSTNV